MAKKKTYEADDLFWALLRKQRVKETMARLILTSKDELSSEKLGLAEALVDEAADLSWEAWEHFKVLYPKASFFEGELIAEPLFKRVREL